MEINWEFVSRSLFAAFLGGIGYSVAQVSKRLFFDRIVEFDNLKSRSTKALIFWADVYSNPEAVPHKNWIQCSEAMRTLSAELIEFAQKRNCLLFWLPKKADIIEAGFDFMVLSNSSTSRNSLTIGFSYRVSISNKLDLGIEKKVTLT